MLVQVGNDIGAAAIAVLEQLEPAVSLGEFFVVKRVDILKIAVQGEEELCDSSTG